MAKRGKPKISKVKRNNQTSNKMAKQGKNRLQRHKQKQLQKQRPALVAQAAPSSDESEVDVMDMVDEDDLAYLKKTSGGFLSSVPTENAAAAPKPPRPARRKRQKSTDSELEEEYEERAGEEQSATKRMRPLLPIKTKDGVVPQQVETDASSEDEDSSKDLKKPPPQSQTYSSPDTPEHSGSESDSEAPEPTRDLFEERQTLSAADLLLARREELREKKYKIGTLSSGLLESPEKKMRNFYPLFNLMEEKNKDDTVNLVSVRKLATLSLYEVFKDILPEYQIKHQDYSNVKLKKDTLALYKFEKELLEFYKRYLQRLERASNVLRRKRGDHRALDPSTHKLGLISLQCISGMLVARPYFNFATNICQTVVPFLNSRDADARQIVATCCETIFREDNKGEISLTLVRRINHLVKSRAHALHADSLRVLLALRIKDVDLDAEKALDLKQKREEHKKKRIINLSKKEKKRNKKLKEVEAELMETQAEESRLSKRANLTEITKTVFLIYFRVLKSAPQSALLSATLEGLAKFAHVINVEYYSDLVAVLSALLAEEKLARSQRLHAVRTVFAILGGQGDALNLDPALFYTHLYAGLLLPHAGKTHTDAWPVLETVEAAVVTRRRKVSAAVLLAFVKRLATLALQLQHNGALACLALLNTLAQHSKAVAALLTPEECVGSGRYDPHLSSPEHCGAADAALFECAALARHYHPLVRRRATDLAAGAAAPPELARLSAEQWFNQYDGSQMAFKPSIPVPQKAQPKKKLPAMHNFTVPTFQRYCEQVIEGELTCNFARILSRHDMEIKRCE